MRRTLAILIAIASCGTVRADVIMPEPTQLTCGRSDVIVAGIVEGTATPGPFTNARPPTVELTATDCFAGCSKGDRLAVARWVDPKPSRSGRPRPADPEADEAAWRAAAVTPPAKGTRALLFLRREGKDLVRVQDSGGYGSYVMLVGGDAAAMQRMLARCRFAVGFEGERDRVAVLGKPIVVHFVAVNVGNDASEFQAGRITLKLQTDTRPGEDFAPTWTAPGPATIAPGARLAFDWDLASLFAGVIARPGHYWLTLDAPGRLGLHWLAFEVK